jgi:hypothetical protein
VAYEYVGNLHTHTNYSDGNGSHEDIALAAIKAGLDFVIVTDHNVWVDGMDGYRYPPRLHLMKMISLGLIGKWKASLDWNYGMS